MTPQELVDQTAIQCDALRIFVQSQSTRLADFGKRLRQIIQQLRKNIEVRDTEFASEFNQFVQDMRDTLDKREPAWTELRGQIRQLSDKCWTGDLALSAKGLNSRAKVLSRSCDEFGSEYDRFCKDYKSFTFCKPEHQISKPKKQSAYEETIIFVRYFACRFHYDLCTD